MSRGNLKLGLFFDTVTSPAVGFVPTLIPRVRHTADLGMDNVCPAKLCVFQDPQPIISRRGRPN
jgi:hypothetical protein